MLNKKRTFSLLSKRLKSEYLLLIYVSKKGNTVVKITIEYKVEFIFNSHLSGKFGGFLEFSGCYHDLLISICKQWLPSLIYSVFFVINIGDCLQGRKYDSDIVQRDG